MPPAKKRKVGGDVLKCGDCGKTFSEVEKFLSHKQECEVNEETGEDDEGDGESPSSPEPSKPAKKRGRPSKAEVAERERLARLQRMEEESCKKCDGCTRKDDCGQCEPCQNKEKGDPSEICILRKCVNLTEDSDVFKAIGEIKQEDGEGASSEPSTPAPRERKQRQSKAACTDFLKQLTKQIRTGSMPSPGKDDQIVLPRRAGPVPRILQRGKRRYPPGQMHTGANTIHVSNDQRTSGTSESIAGMVESGQQVLFVNSDQLSLLQNSQGIVVMQSEDPKTLQVEVVRLNDGEGGEGDGDENEDADVDGDMDEEEEEDYGDDEEDYDPEKKSYSNGVKRRSVISANRSTRPQEYLTPEQKRLLIRKKGKVRLFNTSRVRKNRLFVVSPDGIIIEISGTLSADREKAVARAAEKMPYILEKVALVQSGQLGVVGSSTNPDDDLHSNYGSTPVRVAGAPVSDIKRKASLAQAAQNASTAQIALEDCTADYNVDFNAIQKLPNQVQLIESDLPLSEAENADALLGSYLYRQIYSSQEPMKCLFCKDNFVFKFYVDLEKHYHVIHEIQAVNVKVEFSDTAVFICLPDDVTEETTLKSACQFCDCPLRSLGEVRDHYTQFHERSVRHVYEGQMSNLSRYFYCSMCNAASETFEAHHEHMKLAHKYMTFVCKYCNYCTPRPGRLKAHVKQRHFDDQPGPHLQCTVCSVYVHGKERLMKHVLLSHAVQTGPNIWSCAKCLEPSTTHDNLLAHIGKCPELLKKEGERTNNVLFKCNNCDSTFPDKDEVEKHTLEGKCTQDGDVETEGLDESASTCFLCSLTLNAEELALHFHHVHMRWVKRTVRAADSVPEVTEMICPLNDSTEIIMDESALMERHEVPNDAKLVRIGFPNKVGHYCQLCDVVIKNYTLFYLHMHNLHGMQKRFLCVVSSCSNTFEDANAFAVHCKIHNQRSENFCAMCDMIFDQYDELQDHFISPQHATQYMKIQDKYNRSEPRNYRCRVCHTWHGLYATFVKHMETESHQYQCQHCGLLFVQPGPRRNHIQTAHPEAANTCEICGIKASSAQALWSHLSQHSVVHECSKCHKRFLQKEQLLSHMEIHAPPTPCPWAGCNRKLSTKVGLFNHLRLHRGECDLKCMICGRGFFKKKSLDIHMKTHGPGAASTITNRMGTIVNSSQQAIVTGPRKQAPVEQVRLICAGCLKGFDSEEVFEQHACPTQEQGGQQAVANGGSCEAVEVTSGNTSSLPNPYEGVVSIRKDLYKGVALISTREGNIKYSLEVEGGDGINEIDENIAVQLLRAASVEDVTHLQVEDNGVVIQFKIIKYEELAVPPEEDEKEQLSQEDQTQQIEVQEEEEGQDAAAQMQEQQQHIIVQSQQQHLQSTQMMVTEDGTTIMVAPMEGTEMAQEHMTQGAHENNSMPILTDDAHAGGTLSASNTSVNDTARVTNTVEGTHINVQPGENADEDIEMEEPAAQAHGLHGIATTMEHDTDGAQQFVVQGSDEPPAEEEEEMQEMIEGPPEEEEQQNPPEGEAVEGGEMIGQGEHMEEEGQSMLVMIGEQPINVTIPHGTDPSVFAHSTLVKVNNDDGTEQILLVPVTPEGSLQIECGVAVDSSLLDIGQEDQQVTE